jgi:hypothetical protein
MRGQTPDGQEVVVVKRRRMRDRDLLDDRDILMMCQRVQGRPDRETARMFGISRQLLQRRMSRVGSSVETAMRKMVRQQLYEKGLVVLAPDQMDALRTLLRRSRRVASESVA